MSHSHIDVRYVANLARLELSDEEVATFQPQLEAILEHVEALSKLDVSGIEPTAHAIPLPTPLRSDRAEPALDPELAVANAPEAIATAFVVPKVIEGEEEG